MKEDETRHGQEGERDPQEQAGTGESGDTIACEDKLASLLSVTEDLININDLDTLLDKFLLEARRSTGADAGTVFLVKGGRLRFAYVHNDSLFKDRAQTKYHYVDLEIPIDESSLAGYAAKTAQCLAIDDVYHIPSEAPYHFNRDFDRTSGYRTRSVLTVPMQTGNGKVVGVLQLINAQDAAGRVIPFSERHLALVNFFANNAAIAVERAMMTRELILRMIKMAELRDPRETGAHVNRVGAYAAEIYEAWAVRHGVSAEERHKTRDVVRVAAMLHDVGKVAISDTILKKPGRLDEDEFHIIKFHTIYGARLFGETTSELDRLSQEIALDHHERFDGTGYPGHVDDIFDPQVALGRGKRGEEIPLAARITALADVFDALISRRVYKDPWPEEKVLATIRRDSGSHFDPQVVDAFLEIYPVIKTIRQRYPDAA